MATYQLDLPDNLASFFKKLVVRLGLGPLKKVADTTPQSATVKRPRTKIEQDFVDGYREMVEADNGTGPALMSSEEFLAKWNSGQDF